MSERNGNGKVFIATFQCEFCVLGPLSVTDISEIRRLWTKAARGLIEDTFKFREDICCTLKSDSLELIDTIEDVCANAYDVCTMRSMKAYRDIIDEKQRTKPRHHGDVTRSACRLTAKRISFTSRIDLMRQGLTTMFSCDNRYKETIVRKLQETVVCEQWEREEARTCCVL